MPTAVITGCNSGIGHAFARKLIDEKYDVAATDRDFGQKLTLLGCPTYTLDVTSPQSIHDFRRDFGDDKPIDILLNIAGVMADKESDSLETTNLNILNQTFAVNTFGPLLLTQALLPNLLLAGNAKIGIMSSRVGSIADNSSGGSYAYRASKAAVNSVGKSMAVDLKEKGIPVVIMHPGFVKTGLHSTGKTQKMAEAVEPEEAAGKLWSLFQQKGIEETGRFWHREGMELEW